jgi:hypothetical protein
MTDNVPALPSNWSPEPLESGRDLLPTTPFQTGENDLIDVDPGELRTPILKLDNGSEYAQENRDARDKFFIELGDRVIGEEFRCWVLWIKKGHLLLPNDKHPGHAGIEGHCTSMDMRTGTQFGDCRACGRADWNVAKQNGWRKPACDTTLSFGLWLEDIGHAVFTVRSGAGKYARDFARSCAPRNPFTYPTVFRIGTETFKTGPNEKKTINIARMSWDNRVRVPQEMQDMLTAAAKYTLEQRMSMWNAILSKAEDGDGATHQSDDDAPF